MTKKKKNSSNWKTKFYRFFTADLTAFFLIPLGIFGWYTNYQAESKFSQVWAWISLGASIILAIVMILILILTYLKKKKQAREEEKSL